jgi:hypothetical protein
MRLQITESFTIFVLPLQFRVWKFSGRAEVSFGGSSSDEETGGLAFSHW